MFVLLVLCLILNITSDDSKAQVSLPYGQKLFFLSYYYILNSHLTIVKERVSLPYDFSKLTFFKNSSFGTLSVSNGLEPDQD